MSGLIGDIGSRSGIIKPDVEEYYTSSFSNSWNAWDITNPPSDENGMTIQRYGKIYVIHLAIYRTNQTTGISSSSQIKTLTSSDITLPSENVRLGANIYGDSSQSDKTTRLLFNTAGNVTIYYTHDAGSTFYALGNFIGIDQG